MSRSSFIGASAALLVLLPSPSFGQEPDVREEIEALKKGQQEIQKQLEEIKKLVQARPAARPAGPNVKDVVFDLGDNPVKGADTAKLTLVEFTDYQ